MSGWLHFTLHVISLTCCTFCTFCRAAFCMTPFAESPACCALASCSPSTGTTVASSFAPSSHAVLHMPDGNAADHLPVGTQRRVAVACKFMNCGQLLVLHDALFGVNEGDGLAVLKALNDMCRHALIAEWSQPLQPPAPFDVNSLRNFSLLSESSNPTCSYLAHHGCKALLCCC